MDIQQDAEYEAKLEVKPVWSFLAKQVANLVNLVAVRHPTCLDLTNAMAETCRAALGLHHLADECKEASRTAAKWRPVVVPVSAFDCLGDHQKIWAFCLGR